jgi:hypothetical protein
MYDTCMTMFNRDVPVLCRESLRQRSSKGFSLPSTKTSTWAICVRV